MLRSLLTIGFLQLLAMIIQLGRTKALALLLGPELVGIMAVIDKLLAVIAQTVSLSLPFAALRFLPPLRAGSPEAFASLYRRMRNVLALLALAAGAVCLALTVAAPRVWGATLLPYRSLVLVALLTLPTMAFVPFLQSAIAGGLRERQSMLFALANAGALALTAVIGVWWRGVAGLYALYSVAGLGLIAFGDRLVRTAPGAAGPPPRAPQREGVGLPAAVWRFSVTMLALAFLTPYAALFVHYRILGTYGAETAGWMQAAVGISLSVRTLFGAAHTAFLLPNVSRGGAVEDRLRWAAQYQRTLGFLVALLVPPLLLFPDVAIRLLYSGAFLPGASFVALFVAGEVATLMLAGVYQTLIIALGHTAVLVVQNVVAQLILVGAAVALIGPLGIAGAAVAGIIAQLFLFAVTMLFLRRAYAARIPARNYALALFVAAALAAAGALGVERRDLAWLTLLTKGGCYALIVSLLAVFLTPHDWVNLRRLLGGLRGGSGAAVPAAGS